MKKHILALLAISLFLGSTQGENYPVIRAGNPILITDMPNEKETIAIWPFEGEGKFDAPNVLHGFVSDGVNKTTRFNLIERQKLQAILTELDIQMGYSSVNSKVLVEQGHILGANYNLFGMVNSISTQRNKHVNKETREVSYSWDCTISISLRIVDIETGLVKDTEIINAKAGLLGISVADTEIDAWNSACKKVAKKTQDFIKRACPLVAEIAQIEKEKSGAAVEILISGGSALGIKKKDKLEVFEVSLLNGKEREVNIASLIVKEVQGANFSICKVKKGGQLLKDKIIGGATLICKSK